MNIEKFILVLYKTLFEFIYKICDFILNLLLKPRELWVLHWWFSRGVDR